MKIYYIALLLLFTACSSQPAANFLRDTTGKFALNSVGAEFFALQIPGSTFSNNTIFDVNNAGEWSYQGVVYLTSEKLQSPSRAVYRFNSNNTYFAVIFSEKRLFMVSTNTVSRPEDVDFSFLVPIAVKK